MNDKQAELEMMAYISYLRRCGEKALADLYEDWPTMSERERFKVWARLQWIFCDHNPLKYIWALLRFWKGP